MVPKVVTERPKNVAKSNIEVFSPVFDTKNIPNLSIRNELGMKLGRL